MGPPAYQPFLLRKVHPCGLEGGKGHRMIYGFLRVVELAYQSDCLGSLGQEVVLDLQWVSLGKRVAM